MSKITLEEQTTPGTVSADMVDIYPKAGGGLYKKNDELAERRLAEQAEPAEFTEVTVTGLTASSPVFTDGDKKLESKTASAALSSLGGIAHSLATAANDFLVASGVGAFVKKTLAEVRTILGLGSAAYIDIDTDGALTANSDSKLPTQKAVKTYVDAIGEAINALQYKGTIDCAANPNYPAANAGHVYLVSVAGKIGGASGPAVAVGNLLLCKTDSSAAGDHATVGANWNIVEESGAYATTDHDATHIQAGSDEIDGDKLDIDWVPDNYIPTVTAEADNVAMLTPHLKGIDNALAAIALPNDIGTPGSVGYGVGICPSQYMPTGMIPRSGTYFLGDDNYGNYLFRDGSVLCWCPMFYYRIGHPDNPTYATYGVNSIDTKNCYFFESRAEAEAAGYALHRAFIDGDTVQPGFFFDKYLCSKNALGAGYVASSIQNGLPLSTAAAHNPIADLTACATNYYYEAITAAHARDGVDGAVNASSIFHVASRFQYSALAILALAHGQAATGTTNCAWYHATYNTPKGCNNNALKDQEDNTVIWQSDGYSNCGKTGSAGYGGGAGNVFAKSTHNGQNCGVADLNGLMWEISIGLTSIVPAAAAIEGISSAAAPVFTWTAHGLTAGDYIMILAITQADWVNFKDKIWKVAATPDADTFTLTAAPDTSGYAAYVPGTDPGTFTKAAFYAAKKATAMKTFTSGNAGATDHWGATGVAAMMDAFAPAFEAGYPNNGFTQKFGSGANQVLAEDVSGAAWLLAALLFPKDADGVDTTGANLFGKDYFYQYFVNELVLISGGDWYDAADAGLCAAIWSHYRSHSSALVGFRLACYPV